MAVRAFVVHWEAATLAEKEDVVRAAGAEVVGAEAEDGRRVHDEVRRLAPDVLVVWLTWKPSHGRVTAAAIRATSWGRKLPILFIDDPATPATTLASLKAAVPDAIVDVPSRTPFWVGRIAAMPVAPANNP